MPTCWCRAERNRCWRSPASMFPAPGRPPGRRCRTTKWRTRAGWARPPAFVHAERDLSCSWAGPFFFPLVELPQHLGEAVRDTFAHDVVVHRPQLLADLALDVPSEPAAGLSLGDFGLHGSGPA